MAQGPGGIQGAVRGPPGDDETKDDDILANIPYKHLNPENPRENVILAFRDFKMNMNKHTYDHMIMSLNTLIKETPS
jgi:hypothetical protein